MDNGNTPIKPCKRAIGVEHYAWSIGELDRFAMAADYFVAVFG
jgi:hypothetical protein